MIDLKHLLVEAKQKIPPVLAALESQNDEYLELGGKPKPHSNTLVYREVSYSGFCVDERGCSFCGGLGHRITECPKLEAMQNKQAGSIGRRDYLANSSADW